MRILVISDLPRFVTGGAEMQAMRLIEAWVAQGHEVICLGRRMGTEPVFAGSERLETHRIQTIAWLGRAGRALSYAGSLTLLLLRLRKRIDIVYTRFLNEAAATTALLKAGGLLHVTLVATPANVRGQGDASALRSVPLSRKVIAMLDQHCDAINLIADDMAMELRQTGFSGRNFTHIPNGIRVRLLKRVPATTPMRLVAVGRLTAQKGYDVLLYALARLKKKLQPGQVTIVGDGPDRTKLQMLGDQLGVSPFLVWAGELNQPAVQHMLDTADVYLLPSRYEGMSNAGLEAMERGLPMILTRCGGLDRHVDDGMGWLAEPGDAASLADALESVLASSPDDLLAKGARCRALIESAFDLDVISRRYIALFEALAHQGLPTS